jgi:hypothetical protein
MLTLGDEKKDFFFTKKKTYPIVQAWDEKNIGSFYTCLSNN